MAENQILLAQYFEQTNARLERIEEGLIAQKSVLNFEDFCKYVGISKSWGYKLTSQRAVPHYSPNGKTLLATIKGGFLYTWEQDQQLGIVEDTKQTKP